MNGQPDGASGGIVTPAALTFSATCSGREEMAAACNTSAIGQEASRRPALTPDVRIVA